MSLSLCTALGLVHTLSLRLDLVLLQLDPEVVRELVCECCYEEDLCDGAGEGFVEGNLLAPRQLALVNRRTGDSCIRDRIWAWGCRPQVVVMMQMRDGKR